MSQRLIRLTAAILALSAIAARAAEIRKLPAKHITLYTDLPSSPAVDALPEMFDQALPQWCQYFGIDAARHAAWHVTGSMMKDPQPFRAAGLLSDRLPPFKTGYSVGTSLWVYDQPTDYYRAHLFLHEGTHSFVSSILGQRTPPWYTEGIAELLGTHRWRDGRLTLGYFPVSPEDVPGWGRIKIVRDGFAAHRPKTLREVFDYGPQAHREVEPYGWCWAAAVFLDRHPRYQERFRQLTRWTQDPDLTGRFMKLIGSDWDQLAEEWQVFVADLEYAYDFQRTAIDFSPGRSLPGGGKAVTVAADRGWQNSGLRLEAGVAYRLRAGGRYQVGKKVGAGGGGRGAGDAAILSEPNGVSIRYYHGQPLGILLAAVRPDRPRETDLKSVLPSKTDLKSVLPDSSGPSALIRPTAIGLGTDLTPTQSGTLFLRINHSAGELKDNAGTASVEVERGTGMGGGGQSRTDLKSVPHGVGEKAQE